MLPTASAVVSDAVELGRNLLRGTSGRLPHLAFHEGQALIGGLEDAGAARHPWYLRVPVRDELGVLGQITQGLGAAGISVSRILQDRPSPDGPVQVVLMTHSATFASVLQFESCVRGETWCLGAVQAIPIEEGV